MHCMHKSYPKKGEQSSNCQFRTINRIFQKCAHGEKRKKRKKDLNRQLLHRFNFSWNKISQSTHVENKGLVLNFPEEIIIKDLPVEHQISEKMQNTHLHPGSLSPFHNRHSLASMDSVWTNHVTIQITNRLHWREREKKKMFTSDIQCYNK